VRVRAHIWHHNGGSGLSRRVDRSNPDSLWSFSEDAIGSRGVGLPWGRATGPLPLRSDGGGGPPSFTGGPMPEPLSRLQLARDEINKTFGPDFAEQHPELVIAVMNAASSDWAACANTVGPSCFTGARCTIVWPSQPPFGRIIETFIFWTSEVPHTRTQPASASYRNASSGLLACLPCTSHGRVVHGMEGWEYEDAHHW
jgi:hypothetical protein